MPWLLQHPLYLTWDLHLDLKSSLQPCHSSVKPLQKTIICPKSWWVYKSHVPKLLGLVLEEWIAKVWCHTLGELRHPSGHSGYDIKPMINPCCLVLKSSWDTLKDLTCLYEGKWRRPIRCHMQKKVNPMLCVLGKSSLPLSCIILSTETTTSYSGYHLTDTIPPNCQRLAENSSFIKKLIHWLWLLES